MNEIKYLTPEGKAKLEAELEELKTTGRLELAERLKHAISMGDLSENADYHKAKEDQGFMEGRIQEIEAILSNSKVIEARTKYDEVTLGARVTIKEADYPEETYHLVGVNEANPREAASRTNPPSAKRLSVTNQVIPSTPLCQMVKPSGWRSSRSSKK